MKKIYSRIFLLGVLLLSGCDTTDALRHGTPFDNHALDSSNAEAKSAPKKRAVKKKIATPATQQSVKDRLAEPNRQKLVKK